MPNHMQTAHTISRLFKDLDCLCTLALAIPQSDGSIITPTNDHTAIFSAQTHTVDPAEVPAPSFQCSSCSYVPKKDLLVTANAGEPGIVVCDSEIEDLVAVGRIALDETRFGNGVGSFGRVVEVDGPVT